MARGYPRITYQKVVNPPFPPHLRITMTHVQLTLSTVASAMAVGFVPVFVDHTRQDVVQRFGISPERAERCPWLF